MKLIKYLATNSASTWPGDEVFMSQINELGIPFYQNDEMVTKFSYLKWTYMTKWYGEQENPRFDFRLKLHNMKENINMNTLTKAEKEVMVFHVT